MKCFAFFNLILISFFGFTEGSPNKINWQTDYTKAIELSRKTSQPMLLFFKSGCEWCQKLEKEVLNTPEFARAMNSQLIFIKIDDPKQNDFQARFFVRSYPTVVLIDQEEQQIGTTGYRTGGAYQYTQHLKRMIGEYLSYKQQIQNLAGATGKELKRLYQKAQELGRQKELAKITEAGIRSNLSHFFLAEKYRHFIQEGKGREPEAVRIKKQLIEADPTNEFLSHYHLAVMDFECQCEDLNHQRVTIEEAVAPLVTYIQNFGTTDYGTLWRLHMIISQTYLDHGHVEEALTHAKEAKKTAPESIQSEISAALEKIQEMSL